MKNDSTPKPSYDVERVIQALSSFAGVAKQSDDPKVRDAAHLLLQNLRQSKVKS